jgi:2-amino-4-hydroxy-6-hydroxymethyldihydropteridine diphosphokinase
MTRAFISLGSNVGQKKENIMSAVTELRRTPGVRVERLSSLYETDPVGRTDQPRFLNAVVEIESDLAAEPLLKRLLEIEAALGRVRAERWGPRTIDLDLLLFGQERFSSPALTVPHPRMAERRFVLEPLAELEPDLVLPGDDRTVRERLGLLSRENRCA